ncbi:predicted protein [Postia placenta Mad-698-R]|nr:predicted protein [Postia placenta Mad-698-R]
MPTAVLQSLSEDELAKVLSSAPFVQVEGIINIRDFGGHSTSGDAAVKPSYLFRSGEPSRITQKGMEQFQTLGIRKVFDLRADAEIAKYRTPDVKIEGVEFVIVSRMLKRSCTHVRAAIVVLDRRAVALACVRCCVSALPRTALPASHTVLRPTGVRSPIARTPASGIQHAWSGVENTRAPAVRLATSVLQLRARVLLVQPQPRPSPPLLAHPSPRSLQPTAHAAGDVSESDVKPRSHACRARAQKAYAEPLPAIDAPPLTVLLASDGGRVKKVAKRGGGGGRGHDRGQGGRVRAERACACKGGRRGRSAQLLEGVKRSRVAPVIRVRTPDGAHGVIKGHLKSPIHDIDRALLETLAACADVNRLIAARQLQDLQPARAPASAPLHHQSNQRRPVTALTAMALQDPPTSAHVPATYEATHSRPADDDPPPISGPLYILPATPLPALRTHARTLPSPRHGAQPPRRVPHAAARLSSRNTRTRSYAHLRRGARLGFSRVAATPSTTRPDQTCIPARRIHHRQDARARPCPRPRPVLHFICATRAVVRLAAHPQGRRRAREIFNAQGETLLANAPTPLAWRPHVRDAVCSVDTHCACRTVCPAGDELTSPPSPSETAVGLCQEGLLGCEYARVQARQRIAIAIGTAGVETLMGSAISVPLVQMSTHGPRGCNNSVPLLASLVTSEATARRGLHGGERACCASRDPYGLLDRQGASSLWQDDTQNVLCDREFARVRARRRNGYQQRELSRDAVAKRYHTWGAPGSPLAAVPRRPACCMRSAREHLLTWSDGVVLARTVISGGSRASIRKGDHARGDSLARAREQGLPPSLFALLRAAIAGVQVAGGSVPVSMFRCSVSLESRTETRTWCGNIGLDGAARNLTFEAIEADSCGMTDDDGARHTDEQQQNYCISIIHACGNSRRFFRPVQSAIGRNGEISGQWLACACTPGHPQSHPSDMPPLPFSRRAHVSLLHRHHRRRLSYAPGRARPGRVMLPDEASRGSLGYSAISTPGIHSQHAVYLATGIRPARLPGAQSAMPTLERAASGTAGRRDVTGKRVRRWTGRRINGRGHTHPLLETDGTGCGQLGRRVLRPMTSGPVKYVGMPVNRRPDRLKRVLARHRRVPASTASGCERAGRGDNAATNRNESSQHERGMMAYRLHVKT